MKRIAATGGIDDLFDRQGGLEQRLPTSDGNAALGAQGDEYSRIGIGCQGSCGIDVLFFTAHHRDVDVVLVSFQVAEIPGIEEIGHPFLVGP